MSGRYAINFNKNFPKLLEVIVWLADKKPKIGMFHVAKILFYADKEHLNKYGRPITSDHYMKMKFGPVPSAIKDIVDRTEFLEGYIDANIINQSLLIEQNGNYKAITAKRLPNMDYFSESEIECLMNSLSRNADIDFKKLSDLTHEEKAWLEADDNRGMDFELMIDDDNPHKNEIIQDLIENSNNMYI